MPTPSPTTTPPSASALHPGNHLLSLPYGKSSAPLGVEFVPMGFTPEGEVLRVYVNANDEQAFCLEDFAAFFCGGKPLVIGPMEFVAIFKHDAQGGVVLPFEPRHADRCLGLGHESAFLLNKAGKASSSNASTN